MISAEEMGGGKGGRGKGGGREGGGREGGREGGGEGGREGEGREGGREGGRELTTDKQQNSGTMHAAELHVYCDLALCMFLPLKTTEP